MIQLKYDITTERNSRKMKKAVRATCITLAAAMLALLLVGCTGDPGGETTTGANVTTAVPASETTATVPETDENGYIKSDLPGLDFGDQKVSVLYWKDSFTDEFVAEDGQTDMVLSAINRRNKVVESTLGIQYEWVGVKGNNSNRQNYIDAAQKSIKANDGTYDILAGYSMCIASLSSAGLLRDLNELEYINTDMPWWPERLVSEATINDHLYFASGDISTNMLWSMLFMIYNKDLMKELNIEDNLATLVDRGEWTLDKLEELCRNVYADNDGVEGKSAGDRLGLITSNVYSDAFFFGCGLHTVEFDESGIPTLSDSFGSEKTHDVLVRLLDLLYGNDGLIVTKNYGDMVNFVQNNSLFEVRNPTYLRDVVAGTKTSFGVLPMPLYNSDQDKYVTTMGFTYTLYAVPIDSKIPNVAAAAIECAASEAYRKTTPAIFEVCLKVKYASDYESGRMFDIIREGVTFDLGRMFCLEFTSGGTKYATYNLFRHALVNNTPGWMTIYSAEESALKADLAKVVEGFKQVG